MAKGNLLRKLRLRNGAVSMYSLGKKLGGRTSGEIKQFEEYDKFYYERLREHAEKLEDAEVLAKMDELEELIETKDNKKWALSIVKKATRLLKPTDSDLAEAVKSLGKCYSARYDFSETFDNQSEDFYDFVVNANEEE